MSNSKIWLKIKISGNFCRQGKSGGLRAMVKWREKLNPVSLSGLTFVTLGVESAVWAVLPSNTRMGSFRLFSIYRKARGSIETPRNSIREGKMRKQQTTCTSDRWFGRRLQCWASGKGDSCILYCREDDFWLLNPVLSAEFDVYLQSYHSRQSPYERPSIDAGR